MIIEYNWYELKRISQIPENHLLLMFALYVNKARIDKKLSGNLSLLKTKLNIKFLPSTLFTSNLLITSPNGIFSNYRCIEPQNYITNCTFLHSKHSAKDKSDYIFLLGHRALNNYNNYIDADMVDKSLHSNPFIYRYNNKIFFKLEKQQ